MIRFRDAFGLEAMSMRSTCCDRRTFLRGALALCATAVFPEALARGSTQLHVFLQEIPSVFTGELDLVWACYLWSALRC